MFKQDTLTLFRGDYEKIKEFDFHKTNKYCYLGPGVYLTNSEPVADSYRDKGHRGSAFFQKKFWSGLAKDRPDALSQALPSFIGDFRASAFREGMNPWVYREQATTEKARKSLDVELEAMAIGVWRELIGHRLVTAEHENPMFFGSRRTEPRSMVVNLVVPKKRVVGYLSKFDFPRKEFETSMIHILRKVPDHQFWEIIWDHGLSKSVGTVYADRDSYVSRNIAEVRRQMPTGSGLEAIRRVTSPFGYRGFEYTGGAVIGGFGNHRAFVVWDDEYVNQHKVARYR